MASRSGLWTSFAVFLMVMTSGSTAVELPLREDFYMKSCPNVSDIVLTEVKRIVTDNVGMAAGLLRLHFHDCFVMGCDASVLLTATSSLIQSEMDSPPNANSLRGFQEVDEIKSAIEAQCPGIVSCADILAIAARDATVETGGPTWPVPLGRRDGFISSSLEAQKKLPPSDGDFAVLVNNFAAVGLDPLDMLTLSGAHTLGRGRCVKVWDRLYNFSGVPDNTDPSLDPTFAASLKTECPKDNTGTFIPLDSTNSTFDNVYYVNVLAQKGVFQSDAALLDSPLGMDFVTNATNDQLSFFAKFALAMVKMGQIDLKTGNEGEVRTVCSVSNPSKHPSPVSSQ